MGNERSRAPQPDGVSTLQGQFDRQASNDNQVFLNVYHLSRQLANANEVLGGALKFGGAFHVGVEVYGKEWYYCRDGILANQQAPRKHSIHVYSSSVEMGRTAKTRTEVFELITYYQRTAWRGAKYHDLRYNCCTFADEFCWQLVGQRLPPWVDRVPKLAVACGLDEVLIQTRVTRPSQPAGNLQSEPGRSDVGPTAEARRAGAQDCCERSCIQSPCGLSDHIMNREYSSFLDTDPLALREDTYLLATAEPSRSTGMPMISKNRMPVATPLMAPIRPQSFEYKVNSWSHERGGKMMGHGALERDEAHGA
eukprot:gnl/TRDRNA2_/TRDRNA2_199767_c0_seq1.p1 gnl/TRDRNA2_/TRDRNA2_199767_c0~~gnl/TRDRNA2_/TRDRNA2_199767_c0_seq1.p1  ORF type:complete len:309 (+),score=38.56 gnl/TRDRNA2_/TRDRNA2_199767_c0_seq1:55-981(+)